MPCGCFLHSDATASHLGCFGLHCSPVRQLIELSQTPSRHSKTSRESLLEHALSPDVSQCPPGLGGSTPPLPPPASPAPPPTSPPLPAPPPTSPLPPLAPAPPFPDSPPYATPP